MSFDKKKYAKVYNKKHKNKAQNEYAKKRREWLKLIRADFRGELSTGE